MVYSLVAHNQVTPDSSTMVSEASLRSEATSRCWSYELSFTKFSKDVTARLVAKSACLRNERGLGLQRKCGRLADGYQTCSLSMRAT